jgi:hypothetical protein
MLEGGARNLMAHPRFWEIEGLCSDGHWSGVYQAATEAEGKRYLAASIMAEDELHDRWDDFRLVPPTAPQKKIAPLPTTVQPATRAKKVKRGSARRKSA